MWLKNGSAFVCSYLVILSGYSAFVRGGNPLPLCDADSSPSPLPGSCWLLHARDIPHTRKPRSLRAAGALYWHAASPAPSPHSLLIKLAVQLALSLLIP